MSEFDTYFDTYEDAKRYASDLIEWLKMGWEVIYIREDMDGPINPHDIIPWFPSFDAALEYATHRNRWDDAVEDDDIVIIRRMDGGDRQIIITNKTQISEV